MAELVTIHAKLLREHLEAGHYYKAESDRLRAILVALRQLETLSPECRKLIDNELEK